MRRIPITVRIPEKILVDLDKVSEAKGYTRAEAVREAIRKWIKIGKE